MTEWTPCGCQPTQADIEGHVTRCSRDGVSEHLLTTRGLTVRTTPTEAAA